VAGCGAAKMSPEPAEKRDEASDNDEEESSEDDFAIVINPETAAPAAPVEPQRNLVGLPIPSTAQPQPVAKGVLDIHAVGKYDGVDIFDVGAYLLYFSTFTLPSLTSALVQSTPPFTL
jgi:hypothetical protein